MSNNAIVIVRNFYMAKFHPYEYSLILNICKPPEQLPHAFLPKQIIFFLVTDEGIVNMEGNYFLLIFKILLLSRFLGKVFTICTSSIIHIYYTCNNCLEP